MFDRLLAGVPRTTVIDLGYGPFEQFFDVMTEIGFVQEAWRRSIEPIVLFVTDPSPGRCAPMPMCAGAWRPPPSCRCTTNRYR
jgi:hypothetical protein